MILRTRIGETGKLLVGKLYVILRQTVEACLCGITVKEEKHALIGALGHLHIHHIGTQQFYLVATVLINLVQLAHGIRIAHLLVVDIGQIIERESPG